MDLNQDPNPDEMRPAMKEMNGGESNDDGDSMPDLEDRTPSPETSPKLAKRDLNAAPKTAEISDISEDGWQDLLGSGRLRKKVLEEGEENTKPQFGDLCTAEMTGHLGEDGEEVLPLDRLEFILSESEVIKALDIVVPVMNKGEKCRVIVESDFAYGDKGLLPNVPPKATLALTVTLLSHSKTEKIMDMPLAERRAVGKRKKDRGNFWYSRDEFSQAIQCYRKAVEYFDDEDIEFEVPIERYNLSAELQEVIEDRLKTYNNLAQSQIKMCAWDSALASLRQVLQIEPNNEKALYRKAKILMEKGNDEEAVGLLRRVTRLYPNKQAKEDLAKILKSRRKNKENAERLSKKMLGLDKYEEEKEARASKWRKAAVLLSGLSAVVGLAAIVITKFAV